MFKNSELTLSNLLCLNRKFLVYNLIIRNLKLRYRKSYVGILWTMLIPAANALVYYMVFQFVMKVQIPNYLVFLLSGVIPWTFFATSLSQGLETLVGNQGILNKVPIPAYAFPLAETLTSFINFVFAIPVVVLIGVFTGVDFRLMQLLIPVMIALLLLQAYGLSLILAYGFVYFRDLRHIIAIFIQIWFYLTPIIYTTKMLPEKFKFILFLNPVATIFQFIHASLTESESFDWQYIGIPFLWTFLILWVALTLVRKFTDTVVESL